MKIDFSQPLTGLDGKPRATDKGEPVTLGKVAIEALLAQLQNGRGEPEQLDGTAKVRNAKLATDIFASTEPLELKVEDVALLKDRIGRGYDALTVHRAWELLEAPPAPAAS